MEIGKFRKRDYDNTPLSKLSWDKSNAVALIDDNAHKACNLDALTVRVCKALRAGQPSASCDAYLEKNGTYWFIEFKNQDSGNVDGNEIWRKAYDSVSTVRMAIDQTITLDDLCQDAVFLVVYQDDEPELKGLDAIKQSTVDLAEEEEIAPYWGLKKIEGKLYRKVCTIPATEFREKWIPRIWGGEI